MSAATAMLRGAAATVAVLAPIVVAVSECTYVQSIAVVGNRDAPDHCYVRSDTSVHWRKRAADRTFCLAMRCALDQQKGERVTATRTLYRPLISSLAHGIGRCTRYDVPAQRPDTLAWGAPDAEFLKALEQYETTGANTNPAHM